MPSMSLERKRTLFPSKTGLVSIPALFCTFLHCVLALSPCPKLHWPYHIFLCERISINRFPEAQVMRKPLAGPYLS